MKVTIYGTGCYKCVELEQLVAEGLRTLEIADAQVERISDEHVIRRHMALDAIPGLAIDGRLVCEREVPDLATLTGWLAQAHKYEKSRPAA
jgi:hypothetical protein